MFHWMLSPFKQLVAYETDILKRALVCHNIISVTFTTHQESIQDQIKGLVGCWLFLVNSALGTVLSKSERWSHQWGSDTAHSWVILPDEPWYHAGSTHCSLLQDHRSLIAGTIRYWCLTVIRKGWCYLCHYSQLFSVNWLLNNRMNNKPTKTKSNDLNNDVFNWITGPAERIFPTHS